MGSNGERKWWALPLVAFVWTAIQIPFASTAFRVDETNIIRIAERFAVAPLDPYGFFINWGGREESAFHILANPPGVPLWLSLWGETFGWSESVLHVSMVPFGLIAIFALAALAREFDLNPLRAVLSVQIRCKGLSFL